MLRCILNDSPPRRFPNCLVWPVRRSSDPICWSNAPGTINKYISDLSPLANTLFFFPLATISISYLWLHRANLTIKSNNLLHCMWTVLQYDCRFPAHLLITSGLNMERSSPTRGSPSAQLTAFNAMGYDPLGHRGNPVSLPGMETIRPTA